LGIGDRKTIVKRIASQHIPGETAARRTKASFDEVFFNRHTRGFAERWDGGGVDTQLVQLEQLRHRWLSPSPNAGTGLLLQTAWLTNRI